MVKKVAYALARVANLRVPIRKKNWTFREVESSLAEAYGDDPQVNIKNFIQELNFETLAKHDLREEFAWLRQNVDTHAGPVVFTHSDFRSSNILVSKSGDIKLVDLEYCYYGYRSTDMCTLLMEWDKENGLDFTDVKLPKDEAIETFVRYYLEECDRIQSGYSAKPENSVSRMVQEIKFYFLMHLMMIICFFLKQKESFVDALSFVRKENLVSFGG